MDVLGFKSQDERIAIQVATAADVGRLWQRFSARIAEPEKAHGYCDYSSTLPGTLTLHTGTQDLSLPAATEWNSLPPVFYETALYNFAITFRAVAEQPRIVHQLKGVAELFTSVKIGENEWLLSAPLDFLNEPGIFDLRLRYRPIGEQERTDTFTFRIVSSKLDAKEDYRHILEDINREYNDIVYQYLSKTFQNLTIGGRSDSDVVWLSIFRDIVENYLQAVTYIVNRPHLRETREVRYSRPDRIKRWSPQMAQLYRECESGGTLDRIYFRHEITENTSDTRENRFVKFTVERISRRLDRIFANIKAKAQERNGNVAQSEIEELDGYRRRLRKLANSPLLRKLRGEPLRSESMVLQKRTGYAAVYRYWLLLQKGIELYEGHTNIGTRPIWELYELWCFLKMRQMVADILGLDLANPDEVSESPTPMLEPFSDSTVEHTVRYRYGGDEIRLHYQHTYNRKSGEIHTATTDNRPDIVLTIRKPDGFELTYLYDAKYRVTDDDRLSRQDEEEIAELGQQGADYPPSDAINQMHRYRDAIYYGKEQNKGYANTAKEIIGGYILFPGRGDEATIRRRYYFRSIESVNIGAFPLLPDHRNPGGEGTLLHEHLHSVLLEQTAYQQIKDSIPQRGLRYTPSVADSNDLVLVGYYRTEQLQAVLDNKLYYVPAGLGKGSINLVSGFESTKYLLLHHGEQRMLLELTGEGPKFYTAPTLESMGYPTPSGDYYLGFAIKSLINVAPDLGIDLSAAKLPQGKQAFRPYFTTFDKLIHP